MEILVQKIDFTKEKITLDQALYIEINGLQIRIKNNQQIEIKSEDSLIIEPTSSNVVLIKEKK